MSEVILTVQDVTKVYTMGAEKVHALRGINLEVAQGEYLSIMGPSGSGKSTIFNMIGGLDSPSAGEVLFEGAKLAHLSSAQLAWFRCHKIGFIFQSFNLIGSMTTLENVSIARVFAGASLEQAKQEAAEVLTRVGLGHRLTHLPSQVSGGQQQRIAIARALVNKPSIILADEPTGNLDLKTGEEIIDLLAEMKQDLGITVITATHDLKMLSRSDRVILIADGQIRRITKKGEVEIEVGSVDGETVA